MTKFRRYKEANCSMFIDKWHSPVELLPCTDDEVWFIDKYNELHVGIYNEEVHAIGECDGKGVKIEDVLQWKLVDGSCEMMKYPEDGATVAVQLPDLDCLALGMYTDRYLDNHGDRHKAVVLHPCYCFDDEEGEIAIEWTAIDLWYNVPEIIMLRPIESTVVVEVEQPIEAECCEDCCEVEPCADDSVVTEVEVAEVPCEDCCPECGQNPCVCEAEDADEISQIAKFAAENPEEEKKDPFTESKMKEAEDSVEPDMAVKVEDNLDSKVEELKNDGYEVVGIEDAEDGSKLVKAKKIEEAKYEGPSIGQMLKSHKNELDMLAMKKDNNALIAKVQEIIEPAITDADQKQYAFEMIQKMKKQGPYKNLEFIYNIMLAANDRVVESKMKESEYEEEWDETPDYEEESNIYYSPDDNMYHYKDTDEPVKNYYYYESKLLKKMKESLEEDFERWYDALFADKKISFNKMSETVDKVDEIFTKYLPEKYASNYEDHEFSFLIKKLAPEGVSAIKKLISEVVVDYSALEES